MHKLFPEQQALSYLYRLICDLMRKCIAVIVIKPFNE